MKKAAKRSQVAALNHRYLPQGEEIGRGSSGIVHKSLDLRTGGVVAIKEVTLKTAGREEKTALQREIDLLKLLTNPYIVSYKESFNTRETLYIVMEFVENGSLASIVKRYGRLPESLTGMYTLQVLEGLHYLHDQGVIHRDIKGANILVSTNGQVKLADFGVATKLESGLDSGAGTVVGTPYRMAPEPERLPSVRERPPSRGRYWMAPEIIQLSGFSAASDVWSVGCTVIELISAKPPFFDLPPMSALFRIVNDPHPPIPEGTSPALTDFLLLCFRRDTAQRPSARALQTHPWLALLLVHTRLERGIRFAGDGRVRCN